MITNSYARCEFLENVPNTGDHCPGVSRKGHYYCIYGNAVQATWFCTCIERTGDFVFHCATELRTPKEIAAITSATTANAGGSSGQPSETQQPAISPKDTVSSQQEERSSSNQQDDSSFLGGFWTGAGVMAACMVAYSVGKRYYVRKTLMKQPVAGDDDPDQGIVWERRTNLNML
mmetsp:Transcript_28756/g.47585  ORF Transcript_28756/g.47585 Transcript_28756/m.47585 type:complete len:175 (-) Transcript_28756:149-673(-)